MAGGRVAQRIPLPVKRQVRRTIESGRRAVRRPVKQREFRSALADIVGSAPAVPTDVQLERLISGWDNPAGGDLDYLRVVMELAAEVDGPILECGSGLTTLLLGAYATQPVWTLEADERWLARVRREVDVAGLHGIEIVHGPLSDHGDFFWYSGLDALPDSFSMVVCDGPAAGSLKGGRTGLMPVMGDRIVSGAPIVVDRAMVFEATVIDGWMSDHGLVAEDTSTSFRVLRTP